MELYEKILADAKKLTEERIAERIDAEKKADDYAANVKKITAENAAKRKAEVEEATAKKKATAATRKAKTKIDKRAQEIEDYGSLEKIWEVHRESWRSGVRMIDDGMPPFEEVKKNWVMLARAVDRILGPMKTK